MRLITSRQQKEVDRVNLGKIKFAMIQGMKHVEDGNPRMTEAQFNNACESIFAVDDCIISIKR